MKTNVKKLSSTEVQMDVIVENADSARIIDNVYKKVGESVNIPGFRKGKIPKAILIQKVGAPYLSGVVTEDVINEFYGKAAIENELHVLSQPEIEVTKYFAPENEAESIEFTAKVSVRPDFEMPKLDGMKVEISVTDPTDEDVTRRIDLIRNDKATKTAEGDVENPDDEDLASILGLESFDELKSMVKDELKQGQLARSIGDAGDDVLEKMLKKVEFELPQKVVDVAVENFLTNNFQGEKKPTDEDKRTAQERAQKDIRSQILLDTYADLNDIKVSQDEILNYLMNTASSYGIDPNMFIETMVKNGQLPMATAEVSRSKTLAHILRQVKVVDQDGKDLDISRFVGKDETPESKSEKKKPASKDAKTVTKKSTTTDSKSPEAGGK
ncbi:MAG: hypothetical protein LBQ41_02485 [Candidatus Ancillula sp.]|jgi:FKBP-type peptidyl-prolyl cis-trans isomerase (trigger factor)|nr:hypothetical protein [Candidatus Ancillula sp.]